MRNYFKTLGLYATASKEQLQKALELSFGSTTDLKSRHRVDAFEVLLNKERLDAYVNTVKLYETLRYAAGCLDETMAKDTHQWQERLSEFDSTEAEQST